MLQRCMYLGLCMLVFLSSQVTAEAIDAFTAKMKPLAGYYTLYLDQQTDKIYVEVPRKTVPFIFQSSLPRGIGSNDLGLDRGQLGKTRLVQFSIHGPRVLLTEKNTQFVAQTENRAERLSVEEAFAESVLYGFDIKAETAQAVLIDYTPFLMTDIHGISERLQRQKEGNFKIDMSRSVLWPERIKSFPKNTELEAKVTYTGNSAGRHVRSVTPDATAITVHLHHSFIELPDEAYQPRAFHPNSGYYARSFQDYAAPLGESMAQKFISRHRLQKKNSNAARSEAIKPIIYYLDPGVPEPVRSALLDGARWWNEAFEAIGYIDAFQVRELPADADPMDVRYNIIQWVHRSTRGWSYGSSVTDPRTGEIMKGHVTLGSLRVRQDMLLAQGMLPPYAEGKNTGDRLEIIQEMALHRIRQLSAHEIGHTLGIAHNFAASPQNRASVMDYPHPLVEFNDEGTLNFMHAYATGMGPWDKFTIAYGYTEFADHNSEQAGLAALLRQAADKGYAFISDRDARVEGGGHPSAHLWDNGSHPTDELARLISVRAYALENFDRHNLAPGRPLDELEQLLVPMYLLHRYQVEAVVKLIGGMEYRYYVNGEGDVDYRPVAAAEQKKARFALFQTLSPEFLRLPQHIQVLLVPKAMGSPVSREDFSGRMGIFSDTLTIAEASANYTLELLLNSERLNRIQWQNQQDQAIAGVTTLFQELTEVTFAPLKSSSDLLSQRVAYVTVFQLSQALQREASAPEVRAALRAHLVRLQQELNEQSRSRRYPNRDFAAYLAHCLDELLKNGQWPDVFKPKALPPGSPI